MKNVFKLTEAIKQLPMTIKNNLIPIGVMFILWMIPAILLEMGKDPFFLKILNFLTAGKSGIVNPDALQTAGGIVSKSLVLTFLIGTVIPMFKGGKFNINLKIKEYIENTKVILKNGLNGMVFMLFGAGLALIFHGFMSTDFSMENSFVSIIGAIYTMFIAQKIKMPLIQGIAPGFIASFILSIFSLNTYLIGIALIIIGGVIFLVLHLNNKNIKKTASFIFASFILLSSPVITQAEVYNKENPGVEIIAPNSFMAYEPFDVVIKVTNPEVKKQIDRIQINTGSVDIDYVNKPNEDADGKNYNGEKEVKFTMVVNEYTKEPRKIELNISFIKQYKDNSGTRGEGINILVKKGITQQTQIVKMDLPSQYTYKEEGNNPFTNSLSYKYSETANYKDNPNVGFGRFFEIKMYPTDGGYYMQKGIDEFDIIAYGISQSPDNSDMVNEQSMEAPKELLETFGATKGALIMYEKQDTKLKTPSTDILMDIVSLNYFFYYVKGNTIFRIWGESQDGVFEGSATEMLAAKKKELYNALASVRLEAVPSETPVYKVEVTTYFFEQNDDKEPINTENTTNANDIAVQTAADNPLSKGAIAIAIVSAIFSTAIAGVAAGAMGANNVDGNKDKRRREYKLIISKTVGNKIKSDQTATIFASVYERIYEEDGTYSEGINKSLSEMIEFSSPDKFVKFSAPTMSEDSRSIDFVAESNKEGKRFKEECTITCKVIGGGGTHRENVIFNIVDEPYVAIEQKLFVLSNSGKTFERNYEPMDFVDPVEKVTISTHQKVLPFEINISKDLKDKKIKVKDLKINKTFNGFFDTYTCEIIAKNKKETAKTIFYVVMCHEGITVDFLGAKPQIIAKLKDDDSGEMVETRVKVRGGLWNEKEKALEMIAPENISLNFEDEKNVFDLLEANSVENPDFHTPDGKSYLLSVAHSLPSMNAVKGTIHVEGNVDGNKMSSDVEVSLEPDKLTYEKEFEKEYENCKRIIEVYMPERFKTKKLMELERAKHTLGLEDLKLFRQKCWGIAERCIMQDRQQYLIDEAWYDEAIASAELMVYIGDIAFDLALSPIGGPIAGFAAAQVKSSFIEVMGIIIENPNKSYYDIIWEFSSNRIEQTLGSADGLIEVPKANEHKKLAIWLTSYVIYRIGYHWWFDKDEDDQPIGIKESVKLGLQDFVGKGFGVLLGDFIGKCGKGRWPEKISITDADQDYVNKQVSKAAKTAFSKMDKVAKKADDAALELYNNLIKYFKSLS